MTSEEERKKIAEELVHFTQKFIALLNDQLVEVRGEMEGISDEVMDSIQSISLAQGGKTKMAGSILEKDADCAQSNDLSKDQFKEVSPKQKAQKEYQALRQAKIDYDAELTSAISKAGAGMKRKMKSLGSLDSKMQELIFTMVGAMSADDVVGQRMEHTISALNEINVGLSELINGMQEKGLQANKVNEFESAIGKKIFDSYTMDEERKCFIKVHGKPPK